MLLLIDNFDSFTYNLVQYFQMLGVEIKVIRNNALSIAECVALRPSRLVISPGPGNPQQAGISKDLIKTFAGKIPILGVCLGHQCIGEIYGGSVVRASLPMHGKTSVIQHDNQGLFAGIPQKFTAMRYHSLIIKRETLPDSLQISAETPDGTIMGIRHRDYSIEGVQFHPESILTQNGLTLLQNFLNTRLGE
jgi:para-aminobenzoate synthetase component 2